MSKLMAAVRRVRVPGMLPANYQPGESGLIQSWYPGTPLRLQQLLKVPLRDWYAQIKYFISPPEVNLMDARPVQAQYASPREFFDKYGFVLLKHKSAVKEWNDIVENTDNDISNIYNAEVEKLIREEIYPDGHQYGKVDEVTGRHYIVRRGPGAAPSEFGGAYATGVHQDYGFGPAAVVENFFGSDFQDYNKWYDKWELESTTGYQIVCFWRPINMKEPLQHKPLLTIDRNTVKREDCVELQVYGFREDPTRSLALKLNDDHMYFYYPGMTNDEVLVFKQFECFKGIDDMPNAPLKTAFHTALDDPDTPKDAEIRKSAEHRVNIFFNRK